MSILDEIVTKAKDIGGKVVNKAEQVGGQISDFFSGDTTPAPQRSIIDQIQMQQSPDIVTKGTGNEIKPMPVDTYRLNYYNNSPDYSPEQKKVISNVLNQGGTPSQFDIDLALKRSGQPATSIAGGAIADLSLLFTEGLKKIEQGNAYVVPPSMIHFSSQQEADQYQKDAISREQQGTKNRFVGTAMASTPLSVVGVVPSMILGATLAVGNTDKGKVLLEKINENVFRPIGKIALGDLSGIQLPPGYPSLPDLSGTLTSGLSEDEKNEFADTLGAVLGIGAASKLGAKLFAGKPGRNLSTTLEDIGTTTKSDVFTNDPALKSQYLKSIVKVHPDLNPNNPLAESTSKIINNAREQLIRGEISSEQFRATLTKAMTDFDTQLQNQIIKEGVPKNTDPNKAMQEAINNAADVIIHAEKKPVIVQETTDGHTVLEGNSRAQDSITKGQVVRAYVPSDVTIPGERIIQENIPRSQVIQDNQTTRRSTGVEDATRLNSVTQSFIQGETKPIETWKVVEVPTTSLDVKSVPKESLPLEAMKVPQRVSVPEVPSASKGSIIEQIHTSTEVNKGISTPPFKLSAGLRRATPAYGQNSVDFRNDLNKALYIIRDSKGQRSASDHKYLAEVMDYTGLSEKEVRKMGDKVLQNIKAKKAQNRIGREGVIILDDNIPGVSIQRTPAVNNAPVDVGNKMSATNADFKATQQGFTYDVQNDGFYKAGETDGIAVAPFPNRSQFIGGAIDEIDFQNKFIEYIAKNKDLISQGLKAGGWFSDSRQGWVIDISLVIPKESRDFAVSLGKQTNQEGIFDMSVSPENGYIPTEGTGLLPDNFDETAILDIIRPYISKQPSYGSTSNTSPGLVSNEGGTASGSGQQDVATDVPTEVGLPDTSPFLDTPDTAIIPEPVADILTYQPNTKTLEVKSGYDYSGAKVTVKNVATTALLAGGAMAATAIPFIGPGVAATIATMAPLAIGAMLAPKTYATFFYKQKILNAFRDENGIPASQLIMNENAYHLMRIQEMMKKFEMSKYIDDIAGKKDAIAKGYDEVYKNIENILDEDAKNLLTGEKLTDNQKNTIKNIFPAALGTFRYNTLMLDYDALVALKKFMAVENLYHYYPQEVSTLLRKSAPEMVDLLEKQTDLTNTIQAGYDFGYKALVDAQSLTERDDSGSYTRYVILPETYKYDLKKGVNDTQGYADLYELLAAKEMEYALADDTKRADMESEISRLRTSILKEKSGPEIDVYRLHSPIAQFLDYLIQYSETITRKQKMDIIEKVNGLDPISVGTKKVELSKIFNVTLVDDLFFPNKLNLPSLTEMLRANKLYGQTENGLKFIQNQSIGTLAAGAGVDILNGALKGAYWLIPGFKQLTQGAYSVAFVNSLGLLKSGARIVTDGVFVNTENVGKFFMENKLSARHTPHSLTTTHMMEEIKMRNEYSRFGVNAIYRTLGNVGTVFDAGSQLLFGGPAEVTISEHVIMNELYNFMDKQNPGKYTSGHKIDADMMIKDFAELPQAAKELELTYLRNISQALFDGITQSGSGISIFRLPFTKFFNRFVSSVSGGFLEKFADVRSLINDTLSSSSFKEGVKEFNSSKNRYYRQSGMKIMGMAITAAIIIKAIEAYNSQECKDDECKKAKKGEAYLIFQRMFGVQFQQSITSAFQGIVSTPAGYYDKLMFSVDDVVQGMWNNNETQREVGMEGVLASLGLIKGMVELATPSKIGMTSYLNSKELTNTDFSSWLTHNATRMYSTDTERTKLMDSMARNNDMDFDGFYWLLNQGKFISNTEIENNQHGFARILMGISPRLANLFFSDKTITDTETLIQDRDARLKQFEELRTIENSFRNAKGSINDIAENAVLALGGSENPRDDHFTSQMRDKFDSFAKQNVDIMKALHSSFEGKGIVLPPKLADGQAVLKQIQESPILYANFIRGIQNLVHNAGDYNSKDQLTKVFSGGIRNTDPLYDALAYFNSSPVYANKFADSLIQSVGKGGIGGSKEEVKTKLDTIEAYLQVAAQSELTSEAALRGVQIAFGDAYEKNILDLKKAGLFSGIEYPYIAESMVALVDARSLSPYKVKDIQPEVDLIKVAPTIEDVFDAKNNTPAHIVPMQDYEGDVVEHAGTLMSTKDSAWQNGVLIVNEKNSPIFAPISGMVVESSYIQGMGNQIKIQDINGRVVQYSNLSGYNVAPGQFVKAGMQVARMDENAAQCTIYDRENKILSPEETAGYLNQHAITPVKKNVPTIERPPVADRNTVGVNPNNDKSIFRHSSADQNWSLYDTPTNVIVQRELDAIMKSENVKKIDFATLPAKIKKKKGTKKTKTSKSLLAEIHQSQLPLKGKSILEQIMKK